MKLTDSIEIAAPRKKIWDVTLDFANWHVWTPTVEYISPVDADDLKPGSEIILKQPKQPEAIWTIVSLEPETLLCWQATLFGIPTLATHRIKQKGEVVVNGA